MLGDALAVPAGHRLGQRRVDEGGRDAVDPDRRGQRVRPLGGEGAGHRLDGGAGHRVGRLARQAVLRAHGGDRYDRAAAPGLDPARRDVAREKEGAALIDVHDLVVLVGGDALAALQNRANPGDIDQPGQRAAGLLDIVEQAGVIRNFGEVGAEGVRGSALAADRFGDLLDLRGGAGAERDRRAHLRDQLRRRAADPAAGPGDENHVTIQRERRGAHPRSSRTIVSRM